MLSLKVKPGQRVNLAAGGSSIQFFVNKIPKEDGKFEVVFHGPDRNFVIDIIDTPPGDSQLDDVKP